MREDLADLGVPNNAPLRAELVEAASDALLVSSEATAEKVLDNARDHLRVVMLRFGEVWRKDTVGRLEARLGWERLLFRCETRGVLDLHHIFTWRGRSICSDMFGSSRIIDILRSTRCICASVSFLVVFLGRPLARIWVSKLHRFEIHKVVLVLESRIGVATEEGGEDHDGPSKSEQGLDIHLFVRCGGDWVNAFHPHEVLDDVDIRPLEREDATLLDDFDSRSLIHQQGNLVVCDLCVVEGHYQLRVIECEAFAELHIDVDALPDVTRVDSLLIMRRPHERREESRICRIRGLLHMRDTDHVNRRDRHFQPVYAFQSKVRGNRLVIAGHKPEDERRHWKCVV